MNEIVSSLLLAGDKFMPEFISMITNIYRIHEFPCNTYRSFIKNKERKQKFKEIGDSRCICQNKLDNACFQHDMAYVSLGKELHFSTLNRTCFVNKQIHIFSCT